MSLIKYSILYKLRNPNVDLKHTGKVNWKAYRWNGFSKNNAIYIYPVCQVTVYKISIPWRNTVIARRKWLIILGCIIRPLVD